MTLTKTVEQRHDAQGSSESTTFVQREEFQRLLVSSRRLVRSDEPKSQIRGLLDMETGRRFLIEQEELFGR